MIQSVQLSFQIQKRTAKMLWKSSRHDNMENQFVTVWVGGISHENRLEYNVWYFYLTDPVQVIFSWTYVCLTCYDCVRFQVFVLRFEVIYFIRQVIPFKTEGFPTGGSSQLPSSVPRLLFFYYFRSIVSRPSIYYLFRGEIWTWANV